MISSSFCRRLSQFGSNPCFMAPAGKHRAQMKSVMQLVVSAAASYHVLASRYRWGSQECVSIEAHMLSLSPLYCPPWPPRPEVGGRGASRVWMVYSGIRGLGPRDLQEAAVPGSHGVLKYPTYRQGTMVSNSVLSLQGTGFLNSWVYGHNLYWSASHLRKQTLA